VLLTKKGPGSPRAVVSHFFLITLLVTQILNRLYVRSNFSRAGVSREAEKGWWKSKMLQHVYRSFILL